METRPAVAITMGDAAGIGPEVVLKALSREDILKLCRPVVIGSREVLSSVCRELGLDPLGTTVDIDDRGLLRWQDFAVGKVSATTGKAAVEYLSEAVRLVQAGQVAGIVTGPISKESTRLAGYAEMGHMELFAKWTGVKRVATMLVAGPLRVVHLTTHKSLPEACALVTREAVLDKLELTHDCFQTWGIPRPRLGVAALNPHGGEGGLLGRGEIEQIAPAVAAARDRGIDARGPYPADSIFPRAVAGEFDAVLAMYHDQGHIPIKMASFEKSVSVALGLPFVRTSVDHGTAFDIAGKGVASPESMVEAIKVAVSLATRNSLATRG